MSPAELCEKLKDDYIRCRELPDGSVACLGDLFFTRAIYVNCDEYGFSKRFCFENRELATKRFDELKTEDDVPEGAIARRG